MKLRKLYILFLFLGIATIPLTVLGNTRGYCEEKLISAEIERQNENYAKSLEILLGIKPIVESNNWKDLQIRTLHNIGLMYAMILNYDKSIEYLIESYKLAIETSDKLQEIRILNNIAHIYYSTNDLKRTREYIEKAYEGALQIHDTIRIGKFAANIGVIENEMGNLDVAEKYLNIAIATASYRLHDTVSLINTYLEKGKNLYLRNKYYEAENLLLETIEKYSQTKYSDYIAECLLILSKVYHGKKEISKSIYYAKEALSKIPNLPIQIQLYEQLSSVYRENSSYFLALQYQDSMILTKDSLTKLNDRAQTINNQIRFELLNTERELEESQARQKGDRLLFTVIIVSVAFLAVFFFLLLRIQSIRSKQRKIIAENRQKIVELELKEEKNDKLLLAQQLKEQETFALLEKERLNNELELKNSQLVAKTLIQSNRNELIKEIINTLSYAPNSSESAILQSIIRKLKAQLKDSAELDDFLVNFRQTNPTLFAFLKDKHPNLTTEDIRLLSYIYLYLDTKKIAHLLNITSDAYRKRKERLAKKMNLGTIDLYDYLTTSIKSPSHKL